MAGYFEINENDAILIENYYFYDILFYTRKYFPKHLQEQEKKIWESETCPIDVFEIVSLKNQDALGFMAFYNATCQGYKEYKKKHIIDDKTTWDELIELLEKDERFDVSKKEII